VNTLRLWQARLRRRASEPTTGADALSNLVRSEANERLVRALGKLARRQREVLHLVFYQEMSIADAAQVMGLQLGTARTHYERGKRRLRELLRGEEAE
jgi:RNA polymerase sigma-70 factor (ECF subfamily)